MSAVAIRAFHKSFRNAVVSGQGKPGLDGQVATETKLRLPLSQQALVQPSLLFGQGRGPEKISLRQRWFGREFPPRRDEQMGRMAFLAGNTHELVLGAIEQALIVAAAMAIQAAGGVVGGLTFEAPDELRPGG